MGFLGADWFIKPSANFALMTSTKLPSTMSQSDFESLKLRFLDVEAMDQLMESFRNKNLLLHSDANFDNQTAHWNAYFATHEAREEWIRLTNPMFDLKELVRLGIESHFHRSDKLTT